MWYDYVPMNANGKVSFEEKPEKGHIGPGVKMPDKRPASVSKIALMRTTARIKVEGRMRVINFSTLPGDASLSGNPEDLKVVFPAKKASSATFAKVGIVKPGTEDGEQAEPELVVLKQVREPMVAFMEAEGQSYKERDGEIGLATDFVLEHADLFPPQSMFMPEDNR